MTAKDIGLMTRVIQLTVIRDNQGPLLTITAPEDNALTNQSTLAVNGTSDASARFHYSQWNSGNHFRG